jgi:C1A family cysteine protease
MSGAFVDGLSEKALAYKRVARGSMRNALAAGHPVVIGFTCSSSFESQQVASSGVRPMPSPGEEVVGGHCVAATTTPRAPTSSATPAGWGQEGYFWMPYGYVSDACLSSDFWVITRIGS